MSKPCTRKELEESLCYSVTYVTRSARFDLADNPSSDVISQYLDQPAVREHLGVDKSRGNFSSCDNRVGLDFAISSDRAGHTWLYVAGLLEHGVRVLNVSSICYKAGDAI